MIDSFRGRHRVVPGFYISVIFTYFHEVTTRGNAAYMDSFD